MSAVSTPRRVWNWFGGHWARAAVAAAVLALIGGVFGYAFANDDLEHASLSEDPGIAPAEYLYLDNARVLAYLSQVGGGLTQREERSITATRSLDAGVQTGAFKAGGTAQSQAFVKQVVTPTATSNYFRLLDKLQDRREEAGKIIEVDAAKLLPERWDEIREGSFVKVTGVEFALPTYATDYFFLRRSGSPRLRRIGALEQTFKLGSDQVAQVQEWLRRFGKNPRITFSFEVPRQGGPVRMLVPAQYAALADEQSLITGGELTLVGKVVRKVDGDHEEFVDGQTLGAFAPALGAMPRFLIERKRRAEQQYIARLRKGSKRRGAPPELRAPERERLKLAEEQKRSMTTPENLVTNLKDETRLDRPGLVVIPVAVYK